MIQEQARVIILAGGAGTRVRHLYPKIPKPMVPVAGRPFLEWVIQYFMEQGLHKFILSLGYMAHVAEEYFQRRPADGALITTVRESAPLGTGGALLWAQQAYPTSELIIVANGDSLVLADLAPLWVSLERPEIDGGILGVQVEDTGRYGALVIRPDGTLVAFHEKQTGRGLINAGVYFLKRRLLTRFPERTPLSLEKEVFPNLLKEGARIKIFPSEAPFLDIGTPQTMQQAEDFIKKYFSLGD